MIGFLSPLPAASSIEAAVLDNATGRLAGMTLTATDDAAAFANQLDDIPEAKAPRTEVPVTHTDVANIDAADADGVNAVVAVSAAAGGAATDTPAAHFSVAAYPSIQPSTETHAGKAAENANENGANESAVICPDNNDTASIYAAFERIYARYIACSKEHLSFAAHRP